jgi:hypothetical protein
MDRQGLHYMPYYYGRGIKRKQNLAVWALFVVESVVQMYSRQPVWRFFLVRRLT